MTAGRFAGVSGSRRDTGDGVSGHRIGEGGITCSEGNCVGESCSEFVRVGPEASAMTRLASFLLPSIGPTVLPGIIAIP